MNQARLEEQLIAEFGCSRSDVRVIAERAVKLKAEVESDPENWEGPEIESDYIISRLNTAPEHLSVTAKWDWWAGMLNYFDGPKSE